MADYAFHPDALLEYADATSYYLREASPTVAERFVAAGESAIASILAAPESVAGRRAARHSPLRVQPVSCLLRQTAPGGRMKGAILAFVRKFSKRRSFRRTSSGRPHWVRHSKPPFAGLRCNRNQPLTNSALLWIDDRVPLRRNKDVALHRASTTITYCRPNSRHRTEAQRPPAGLFFKQRR
jgi:plasmid stabilization system protein ParE